MDTLLIASIIIAAILLCFLLILAVVCCGVRPRAESPEKVYAFQIPELPVQQADAFHA